MGVGKDRNAKCFCGSGKKFKHCCYVTASYKPSFEKLELIRKKAFSVKKYLYPKSDENVCNEIISSHSITKSGPLRQIAQNGYVFHFYPDLKQKHCNDFVLKKIGINEASTFFGFCKKHDAIFNDIENERFVINDKNCFLIGYRALCLDYYKKCAEYESASKMIKVASNVIETIKAGKMNMEFIKNKYDAAILDNNFKIFDYLCIELDRPLEIVSSSSVLIVNDFYDILIQNVYKNFLFDSIQYGFVSKEDKTYIVFSWLKDSSKSKAFMQSFCNIQDDIKLDKLIQFFIHRSENTYFSDTFYNSLDESIKAKLKILASDLVPEKHKHKYNLNFEYTKKINFKIIKSF